MRELKQDKLTVKVYDTREEMGQVAGFAVAEKVRELIARKGKVNAFHMDEYIGLAPCAPQNFDNFLREKIFDKLPFQNVYYNYGENKGSKETCQCYERLLAEHPVDIVCLGIGENGDVAFNVPWVADFNDQAVIKKVELDALCRQQQVNVGCFAALADVPK